MDQHVLTFCFPFPHGTKGAALVRLAQDVCKANGLVGKPSKMGPHASILPPFYCNYREKKALAALARHMWKFNGREVQAKATGFNVFPPPSPEKESTLYIEIEVDEEYRTFVERHKLKWPFEFVHTPAQTNPVDRVWIPHMSVIEGPGLHEKALPLLPRINEYMYEKIITFGEPLFFEEKISGDTAQWFPVLV